MTTVVDHQQICHSR